MFTGFGVVCGSAGAAVLWWFASQPFDFHTAGYQPLDFASAHIDSPSPYGYMAALVLGSGVLGAVVGALVPWSGWVLTRRTPGREPRVSTGLPPPRRAPSPRERASAGRRATRGVPRGRCAPRPGVLPGPVTPRIPVPAGVRPVALRPVVKRCRIGAAGGR